jgi:hypothetical protein
MIWICVCIVLLLSPNNLSNMGRMNVSPNGYSYVYPSSMSEDIIVFVILSTSQVRPYSTLVED